MKKSFILTSVIGIACVIASGFTVIYSSGEPNHTGSPKDGGATCASCHSGGVTPAGAITASPAFGGSGTSLTYSPGVTYTLTVTETANIDFGFDVEILNGNTSSAVNAGTMTAISSNCIVNGTGPTNITHNARISVSSNAKFKWVAPSGGTAYLYASILGVDGTGGTGGDKVMSIADVLTPIAGTCNHQYTTLPYATSFENTWIMDTCNGGAQRIPDHFWKSNIGGTTPTTNDYWHRNDYTGSDWTSITIGAYTPAASNGNHSATFHNDPPPAGSTGAIDLYINLSPAGTKTVQFDYIHNESSLSPFSFKVLLSTDGGITFPNTLYTITTASYSAWTTQSFTTSATSATSVLRFIVSDKGTKDVGIDNLSVALVSTSNITSLFGNSAEGIEIFPNPARDILNIRGSISNETKLDVFDMTGRLVLSETLQATTNPDNISTLDISSLNEGVYTLYIHTLTGIINKRLVIDR